MTITVDIGPEVQAELARQAAAHGLAIEAHVASLLEDAAHVPAERSSSHLLMGEESRAAKAVSLMELSIPAA